MRVVFDTNIFISALVFPGGQAERALWRVMEGKDRLLLSRPILDEVLSFLARKFARDPAYLSRTALFLTGIAEWVEPEIRIEVLKDPLDNRVLECAMAGRAQGIVTGDKGMLQLREYQGIQIWPLRRYLNLVRTL